MMLDIIMPGGVSETSHISKKNTIKLHKTLRKQLESIRKIPLYIHLWELLLLQADNLRKP